jgi:DNA-binding response OmpR family regulator
VNTHLGLLSLIGKVKTLAKTPWCFHAQPRARAYRERLLKEVWGSGGYVSDRVLDNCVASLRKKIEDNPSAPRYLISIRGVGYRFEAEPPTVGNS